MTQCANDTKCKKGIKSALKNDDARKCVNKARHAEEIEDCLAQNYTDEAGEALDPLNNLHQVFINAFWCQHGNQSMAKLCP